MVEPKIIVISGPSGAGKSTIVRHLLDTIPDLELSVSGTTRKPRPLEENGREYWFMSVQEFTEKIENSEFLEYEEVYSGLFYGTLKSEVSRLLYSGKSVVFDIDATGGLSIKDYYGDNALGIFLLPPDQSSLHSRLIQRGTETPESIQTRISKSKSEIELSGKYDVVWENSDLGQTKTYIEKVVLDFLRGNK